MTEGDDMKHDDLNEIDGRMEDDELMNKIPRPPEFPPATREQIEQTWSAIATHIAADQAEQRRTVSSRRNGKRRAWLDALFTAAPAWSWQLAQVAALLLIGFGVAWIAAGRGWLPGATEVERPTVEAPAGDAVPDRAWLATNDYGRRLEALLLGMSRGNTNGDVAPAAREVSRELLGDSRFYRRVARRNDDAALADLLSRIETVLLALAHAPEGQEGEVIATLRRFITDSDVLGELRAVQLTVPKVPRPRAAIDAGS